MASAAQRNIRSVSYAKYGYFFILPFFLVYCFFQLWPLLNTFILAFYGNDKTMDYFVGLDNFKVILFGSSTDGVMVNGEAIGAVGSFNAESIHEGFITSLINTLILWGGNFAPQIAISLALAVWFTDAKLKIRGKGFFKVVMYMPNIITAASVAALYLTLFADSKYGTINNMLMSMEWIDEPIKFVTGQWQSRIMIMFIQCWMWFGNTMIMLMSGIMGLNPSLFEAANIDGASSGQIFRKITLPLLQPIMLYTLITSMIGGLQMFDIPYLYVNPAATNKYTKTIAVWIYENFQTTGARDRNYGFSAAASLILFLITVALGSIVFYMNRDKEEIKRKKERKAFKKALKAKQKGLGGMEI